MIQNLPLSQSFEIKPSQQHKNVSNVLHFLAILACGVSSLMMLYKAALLIFILMIKHRADKRWQNSIYKLRFTEFSGWEMAFENDDYCGVTILVSSVITPFVIFLHLKPHTQKPMALVIAKDCLSKNDFRRLVSRLTLSGHEQSR
jgi:hypothetical protein